MTDDRRPTTDSRRSSRPHLLFTPMPRTFRNFIAGRWVAPSNGAYHENRNPANTRDLIGRFPASGPEDVEAAVRSAEQGFRIWSRVPAPARGDVLRRVGDLLAERKE